MAYNNKPNLFIVGATKSGTSSLHQYLNQHPDIYMSGKKEPHYFSYNGELPNYRGPGDIAACRSMMVLNQEEYLRLFEGSGANAYRGESSAMYLHIPGTAKNIYKFNPDARIIIILRNPVQRIVSAYNHLKRDGRETETIENALKNENERLNDEWMPFWSYRNQSMYFNQVKEYVDIFPKENVKIFIYEEFFIDINKSLREVCDFLKVQDFTFDTNFKENVSGNPKSKLLHKIVRNPSGFLKFMYQIIPQTKRKKLKYWLNKSNLEKPVAVNKNLINSLKYEFEPEIVKLEELIDRNIDIWR